MKLQDQVCTIKQGEKLKELGVAQESLFYFTHSEWGIMPKNSIDFTGNPTSVFTVAELGVMFPHNFSITKRHREFTCRYWWGNFMDGILRTVKENSWHQTQNKNEAQAAAEMLIYLLENKLTTTQEVNQRLTHEPNTEQDKIKAHYIKCYNNDYYILVTGLPELCSFDIIDKESMPVALMVHKRNGRQSIPPESVYPVNLHTGGKGVELLGLIEGLTEHEIYDAYPLLMVSWKEPGAKPGFVDVSKTYRTYKDAFIAHVYHSYKIIIDPKTTVLLKIKG